MCDRGLKASTIPSYVTAINNVHAAKEFSKPAAGPLMAKLYKGWARIVAHKTNSLPAARGPLAPEHVWALVLLGIKTAGPEWRRKLAAIVLCFMVCRRTVEVMELQLQDIFGLPEGAFHINVHRYKNAEGGDDPRRLVDTISPDLKLPTDPVLPLLRAQQAELVAESTRPKSSTPSVPRAPTADYLTKWLHAAMAAVGAVPPPCVLYSSYSCKAVGTTALYVIGAPLVAVVSMLSHKDNDTRTAIVKYIGVLAPFSPAGLRLCGRWLHAAP